MKNGLILSLLGASLAFGSLGCTATVDGPSTHQDCSYDVFGNYSCTTYYNNGDGTTDTGRDMITNIAQAEKEQLDNQAKHYAEKFSLSVDQGMKIAKTINDFNAVQNRSDADIADFAKRLYGVDPKVIVSAVGKAQAGDNGPLSVVVEEAAKNFDTNSENMKNIVKTLHGKLLEQQGIHF
jgi:hypothetical protein